MWSCPGSVDSFSSSILDLFYINLTPLARSAAEGGRSSEDFSSVCENSAAYKAPGAAISIGPWHWHPRNFSLQLFGDHDHAARLVA